jgi:hypothetical protein
LDQCRSGSGSTTLIGYDKKQTKKSIISYEINDGYSWTVTLKQPAAVQAEAASRAVVKGTHLCPAKVTFPAQGLVTLETIM